MKPSALLVFCFISKLAACSGVTSLEEKASLERLNVTEKVYLRADKRESAIAEIGSECVQGTCGIGTMCMNNTCVSQTLEERCGPGKEVEVLDGGNWIRVRPTGKVIHDFRNLRGAMKDIKSGGTLELCEGSFNLGQSLRRRSVIIRKGVTIKGKYIDGVWETRVVGGGGPRALLPDPFVGPFKVNSDKDPNPVIFDGVWLRDWTSEAIFIIGCNGFTFTRSRMSHPVVTGLGFPLGATSYIHGIIALRHKAAGEMYITKNDFDMTRQYGLRQNDGQALSLYGFPATRFTLVYVEHNYVKTNDEAFEVLGNHPEESSRMVFRENEIDIVFDVAGCWIDHFAFLIAGNMDTDQILIEKNKIVVTNFSLRQVKDVGVFGITGDKFVIRNNDIRFYGDYGGSIFRIGNVGNVIVVDFGMSITNSLIEDNEINGSYLGPGIVFNGGCRNASKNNIFRLGTSMAYSAEGYTIQNQRRTNVCENTWEGDLGLIDGYINKSCDEKRRNRLGGSR